MAASSIDQPIDAEHEEAHRHGHEDRPFPERYEMAMGNAQLSRNLTNFQQSWKASRAAIMEEVEFDVLRGLMKAAKTEAIDNLDQYLEQFVAAGRSGGHPCPLCRECRGGDGDRPQDRRSTTT